MNNQKKKYAIFDYLLLLFDEPSQSCARRHSNALIYDKAAMHVVRATHARGVPIYVLSLQTGLSILVQCIICAIYLFDKDEYLSFRRVYQHADNETI